MDAEVPAEADEQAANQAEPPLPVDSAWHLTAPLEPPKAPDPPPTSPGPEAERTASSLTGAGAAEDAGAIRASVSPRDGLDTAPDEPPVRRRSLRARRGTDTAPDDLLRSPDSAGQAADEFFNGLGRRTRGR
ncbi:MAG TPA: hypothetical protein VEY67_12935 [Candidatus Dormibacteraeota bacterium]|nr:hypothetical protein [Candidatus Dormibacteraeota bacterium]